jgi:hypothetical protein
VRAVQSFGAGRRALPRLQEPSTRAREALMAYVDKNTRKARLEAVLRPTTDDERRLVEWLSDQDLWTCSTLVTMVERRDDEWMRDTMKAQQAGLALVDGAGGADD